ncbi:hypothetical protein HDV05_006310 [Chytridiales sp. JEL 0842]|nr:hypothetical protein HDV05_006310 [Chytridiales sp. JEL 0842]
MFQEPDQIRLVPTPPSPMAKCDLSVSDIAQELVVSSEPPNTDSDHPPSERSTMITDINCNSSNPLTESTRSHPIAAKPQLPPTPPPIELDSLRMAPNSSAHLSIKDDSREGGQVGDKTEKVNPSISTVSPPQSPPVLPQANTQDSDGSASSKSTSEDAPMVTKSTPSPSHRTVNTPVVKKEAGPKDLMPGFERKIENSSIGNVTLLGESSKRRINVLQDGLAFMSYAANAIAQDEFSKCFVQKPRTRLSMGLFRGPLYYIDWCVRYFFLFPYRLLLLLSASVFFFLMVPVVLYFKAESWQRWLFKFYCNAFLRSWGSQVRYHGEKPRLNVPHVFVSNHTSVIDYIVLSANSFPHATVAQTHGGLLGIFEHSILALNGSLMFNRNEKKDRGLLTKKMRAHIHTPTNVPLLIFPEGTCVNNEYTVLFHKGAFEMDAYVCPVAIKYDKQWADAYWHSKTQTFTKHILYLMTRWALVADVWYLPPQALEPGKTSTQFANDVKAKISKQANLKNLSWDGYFKNFAPAKEKQERLRENPQFRYGQVLMNRMMRSNSSEQASTRARPVGKARHHSFKRSHSVCLGDVRDGQISSHPHLLPLDPISLNASENINPLQTTQTRNEILVQLLDEDRRTDMLEEISDAKMSVVSVWKNYTKAKGGESQRRMENSSWRLWFKQRIAAEREKARKEAEALMREREGNLGDEEQRIMDHTPLLSPGIIVVENALSLLSSTVDYFSSTISSSVPSWSGSPSSEYGPALEKEVKATKWEGGGGNGFELNASMMRRRGKMAKGGAGKEEIEERVLVM